LAASRPGAGDPARAAPAPACVSLPRQPV
jgi:hypothetical protein